MSGGGAGCGLHFTLWVLGCQLVGEGLREREQTTSGRVSFHGRTIKEVEREGVGPPRSFLCLQVGRKSSEQDRSVFLDLERNRGPGGVTLRTRQFCLLPPAPPSIGVWRRSERVLSMHAKEVPYVGQYILEHEKDCLVEYSTVSLHKAALSFFFFEESCEISCI